MNEPNNSQLNKEIIELIKRGQVRMRPKVYFALKAALFVLAVVVLSATLLYVVSFLVFALKASGVWLLPGFGLKGFGALLMSLPWILILAVLALVVVIEVMAKHFSFVYRQPILYSLLAVMGLVLVGSFVVGQTRVHYALFERARNDHLPFMGEIYRGLGMPDPRGWSRLMVVEVGENGFVGKRRGLEPVLVIFSSSTRPVFNLPISAGDIVMVMGEREGDTIKAWAVRKIECCPDLCPEIMMMPAPAKFILFIDGPGVFWPETLVR